MSSRCTVSASANLRLYSRNTAQSALSAPRPGTDSRPAGLSMTTSALSAWMISTGGHEGGTRAGRHTRSSCIGYACRDVFQPSRNCSTRIPTGNPPRRHADFFPFVWACIAGARGLGAGHDRVDGVDRCLRGLPVQHAWAYVVDWLARVEPSQLWTQERGHLLLLAAILMGSPSAHSTADADQAPGAGGESADATALEFPPPDARSEHAVLPGRVRRPRSHQGDADRARHARCGDDHLRHHGVRGDLLRHHHRAGRAIRLRGCCCPLWVGSRCMRWRSGTSCRAWARCRSCRPMRAR